jgi:hypothetical protein
MVSDSITRWAVDARARPAGWAEGRTLMVRAR